MRSALALQSIVSITMSCRLRARCRSLSVLVRMGAVSCAARSMRSPSSGATPSACIEKTNAHSTNLPPSPLKLSGFDASRGSVIPLTSGSGGGATPAAVATPAGV
eukprot:2056635-Alexandrium_andersonii.AAC.1